MSKRNVLSLSFLLAGFAILFAFDPEELNRIEFKNATGKNIQTIFLSPSDSEEWGPDIVGAEYHLGDGKSIGYVVHYPGSSFKFDIMATDEAGNVFELYDFTLTDGKEGIITFTRKNLKSSPKDFTFVKLQIENKTDYDMYYLFMSPSDSDAWGVDLLDEDTILSAGESYTVLVPIGDAKVKYNVMSADEDMDQYTFDLTIDPKTGDEQSVAIEASDLEEPEED